MKPVKLLLILVGCAAFASAQKLPNLPNKPKPKFESHSFCPAVGLTSSDHNDPDLNKAKNRIDEADRYFPVDFAEIKNLPRPDGVRKTLRSKWLKEIRDSVAESEGIPITLTGFLALTERRGQLFGGIAEGKELCNCQRTEPEHVDFHLWLVTRVGDKKPKSVVVEMTPHVRQDHRDWTIERLNYIGVRRLPVRVRGWLMIDQEHPEQIGVHRANLWEIHPIMKLEYKEGRSWKTL